MPSAKFKVDTQAKRVIPPEGMPLVINPFDAQAMEAALRIKENHEVKITSITMGQASATEIVKHTLSMGADEGFILDDEAFEGSDSLSTAYILTKAIEKVGDYDLILCGRQASDTDAGITGSGIAELLGIPSITLAQKVSVDNGQLAVERVTSEGFQLYQVPLPALVTISNEVGELRSASLPAIMAAQKKEITVWNAASLGINIDGLKRASLAKLYQPLHEGKCEFIDGQSPEEKGLKLADKLRETKLL